jgi:diguanylate cyclase (GGDEF)-like protein
LFLALSLARQIGSLLERQYDLATGLLTRSAFCQDAQQTIAAGPDNATHSLLHIDIDRLHLLNERLGYQSGDEAIVLVADRLRDPALPPGALTCRLSGDRFVVLLNAQDIDQAWMYAQTLLSAVAQCTVGNASERMTLSISCGIARFNSRTGNLEECMTAAERASKSAKAHGGNRSEIYLQFDDSKLNRRAVFAGGD